MKLRKLFLFIVVISIFALVLGACGAPKAPEVDKPSEPSEPSTPVEPSEPGTPGTGDGERAVFDWVEKYGENAGMILQMVVGPVDEAVEAGAITELEADYLLYLSIEKSEWPRGSSPSLSDVVWDMKGHGYSVPDGWDGPIYLKAPRP